MALSVWLDLLASWNARLDLTAARSAAELVDLMIADAAVLATRLPERTRIVDVGTGAGAPGLALALMRPDLEVTLVEPLAKRIAFLRTVVGTLARSDIVLERCKGEELRRRGLRWDAAMARATLGPDVWLALGADLVGDRGSVLVLLAKQAPPEAPGLTLAEDICYTWPGTGAARRLVRYVRP